MFFLASFIIFLWHCLLRMIAYIRQYWPLNRSEINSRQNDCEENQNIPFLTDSAEEKSDFKGNFRGISSNYEWVEDVNTFNSKKELN